MSETRAYSWVRIKLTCWKVVRWWKRKFESISSGWVLTEPEHFMSIYENWVRQIVKSQSKLYFFFSLLTWFSFNVTRSELRQSIMLCQWVAGESFPKDLPDLSIPPLEVLGAWSFSFGQQPKIIILKVQRNIIIITPKKGQQETWMHRESKVDNSFFKLSLTIPNIFST